MPLSVAHKIRKTSRHSHEWTNMAEQPTPPACPRCSQPMRLIRVTPKIGPLPELFTFKCLSCGHIDTMEQRVVPRSDSAEAELPEKICGPILQMPIRRERVTRHRRRHR